MGTALKDKSDGDSETKEQGWSGLRTKGPEPKWYTHVWQIGVAYLVYDAMFYWSHRFLHHPKLYEHCHKIHHEYHTPIALGCAHHHFVEGVVQAFNCFRWLETIDAHCGYELPFSPFHMLPFCGGARGHDFHHREFNGNYGATIFWDRLCGTDRDFWKELTDEGVLLAGVRHPL